MAKGNKSKEDLFSNENKMNNELINQEKKKVLNS